MTNDEVIARYFHCMDREDWDGMREIWHEDAVMRATGARTREGREQIIDLLSKLFVPWAQHTDAPTRTIPAGDTVTVEITFTGTTHDGRRATFDAVDVFDLRDGRIAKLSNWYDIAYVRKLLAEPATA
jgi:ketosteroid isomerase-like protein